MAEIWGTPIPATTLVVQMEPGPIPIFTQSAPASISAFVASLVATFPAIRGRSGYLSFSKRIQEITFWECPWAESKTITSTWAFKSSAARSNTSVVMPRAAPQSSLPCLSFAALGYLICFSISLMVIKPFKFPSSSTMGSFSTFARAKMDLASSRVVPSFAVIRFSEVIQAEIGRSKSSSKTRSRLVMIPISFFPSVIGTPEILNFAIKSLASFRL